MIEKNIQLAKHCLQAKDVACDFIKWSKQYPDVIGSDFHVIRKDFNRFALQVERLSKAATRPMGVAVFGPSQSGKSYLISALARKGNKPLMANFSGKMVDFIEEINPPGGKESTGIVTRFTTKATDAKNINYPVTIVLLDQIDIVKIISNAYISNSKVGTVPSLNLDSIDEALDIATSCAHTEPVDGVTEAMVYDLRDYFMRYFQGLEPIKSLDNGFWDRVTDLLPRLKVEDRANLLSLLWGGNDVFTQLYIQLYKSLKLLNFSIKAYLPLATDAENNINGALIPREKSVIDVAMLEGLGSTIDDKISVQSETGQLINLPRNVITALISELIIEIKDQPYNYFDHTDLLDFPGYRPSEEFTQMSAELEKQGVLEQLYLRGKVAYLFQRYREEKELNSMVLCVADSNQDVKSLPEAVNEWISETHGETPEQRNGKPVSLFLALTKFDMEFAEKSGSGNNDDDFKKQWDIRLHSSLWSFFGLQHEWPTKWDSQGAFSNAFWIRNPNYKAKHIFEYDDEGLEIQLISSERERARIEKLKNGFLKNNKVTKHFLEPEKAWGEALEINDGGVKYLAEKLGLVCNPELKYTQINNLLNNLINKMVDRFNDYFVTDDTAILINKRIEQSKKVATALVKCSEAQRFGTFVKSLHINEEDVSRIYYRLERDVPEDVIIVKQDTSSSSDLLGMLGLEEVEPDEKPVKLFSEYFADEVISDWISSLHEIVEDVSAHRYYKLPEVQVLALIKEIKAGSLRLGLRESIIEAVESVTQLRINTQQSQSLPVRLTTQLINNFVNYLGFEKSGSDCASLGSEQHFFKTIMSMDGTPKLSEKGQAYELGYISDWLKGFMLLVESNAKNDSGVDINSNANIELGEFISELGQLNIKY